MTNKLEFQVNRSDSFTQGKSVSQYSTQELIRFREEFMPLAESYNRRLRGVLKVVALLLLSLIPFCFSIAYNFSYGYWLFGTGILICFVSMAYLLVTAKITCTACRRDLDVELGAYCPECGSELSYGRKSNVEADCKACGARLRFIRQARGGRVRAYKIRSCSYCGVKLHEHGV